MSLETPSRIEPCLLDVIDPPLADVIAELPAKAQRLEHALHPDTAASLRGLVRVMKRYYSNLIEGRQTRPRDIQRALDDDLDAEPSRRNLQLEARAHIRVQAEVERLFEEGRLGEPARPDFIRGLHAELYKDAPAPLLTVEDGTVMVPGEWRTRDVAVGRHVPPSSARVPEFMDYFAERYRLEGMGPGKRLVALAASHHRFNYIQPFLDGNGRVSRLMSHAMGLSIGIGAHGLWSVSRGLARGVDSRQDYKLMDATDPQREDDFDGRGNLSRRRLAAFVLWFLRVCVDQITFMSSLFDLEQLGARLDRWVDQQGLKPEAKRLLGEIARRGEVERGEAAALTRMPERSARLLLGQLQKRGVLGSRTPKGPVSLRFTLEHADVLLPKLFPET